MVPWKMACHLEAKLFMARRCFKRDVLRIKSSDLDHIQNKHSLGIKEDCRRTLGQSTSRILRSEQVKVSCMMDMLEISWLEAVRQAQMTAQMRGARA